MSPKLWFGPFSAMLAGAIACSGPAADSKNYPTCEKVDSVVPLHEKATRFDQLGPSLHMPQGQDLMHSVWVQDDLQTFDRVQLSDNSGFWTSTYTASQALRYAVTKSPEALANIKRALKGQRDLMLITGVKGLFARSYVNLELPGFPTEQDLLDQYPDCDLSEGHCKRWQRGTGRFENYMFKNDVSRDEYAGHLFAVGVLAHFVDDPEVKALATEIARDVAEHLIDNDLRVVDFDGEVTTFGYLSPATLSGFPGFNAVQVLSFIKVAAVLTGDPRFESFYRNCLLHEDLSQCEDPALATDKPYTDHLQDMGLNLECQTNWNNHNMAHLAMFVLILLEEDEAVRGKYQSVLERQMWNAEETRPMKAQGNTLFSFFREITRHPDRHPTDDTAMEDAVCVMKIFPVEKYTRAVDNSSFPEVCTDRKGRPMTDVLIPFEERPMNNFMWKLNPYRIAQKDEATRFIEAPDDYLLAYWLGRQYGILKDSQ